MIRLFCSLLVGFSALSVLSARADDTPASALPNEWQQVVQGEEDPRVSPALVWSAARGRFLLISGMISHQHQGPFRYDILSLNPETNVWENELPPYGQDWGKTVGPVEPAEFKTPYFAIEDAAGNVRPWRRQAKTWYLGQVTPWDDQFYTLMCGHTLRYDPRERLWQNLEPETAPAPKSRSYKESLNWSAMCPDPVNQELLLFGGCGVATPSAGPGTWVYAPEKNQWRELQLATQPSPRALSPMAMDPKAKKIVLFGGEGLDRLYADTWVYDCVTRTWEQRRPKLSPSPRFGHALFYLPRSGRIVLIGGVGYNSSTSYQARLYTPHPFEIWTYDLAENTWSLIKHYEEGGPTHFSVDAAVAAVNDRDEVLWWSPEPGTGRYERQRSTWKCTIDASQPDVTGTTEFGVPPGTETFRTGSFDPAWYSAEVPEPDPAAQEKFYQSLPVNQWTAIEAPKWPENRQGGGWSTTAFDTDRGQVLHLGGGHSSYFGNDVAHFDAQTARWSISYRPQFALDYNYDLSGPGPWAFNGGPWGNHNYHAYTYDQVRHRLVFIRNEHTHFYDPQRRVWSAEERLANNPFNGSKYTSYIVRTDQGAVVWAVGDSVSQYGIWKLTAAGWQELPTSGEPLPRPVTDGSTITFDAKRNRLLLTTTNGEKDIQHSGQVWAVDLKSGEVQRLDPAGRSAIEVKRFARESVYLPELDLVMLGYHLQKNRIPFYDIEKNRWLTADVPGSDFFLRGESGTSVDLGLQYDPARKIVWAVKCRLHPGDLQVMRVDETLKLTPLE